MEKFKTNLARSAWELRKEAMPGLDGTQLLLRHEKVNRGKLLPGVGIKVVHAPGKITFERCAITAPDLESLALSIADRIGRVLMGGAATYNEIADAIGASAATVRSAVRRAPKRFRKLPGGRVGLAF